MAGPNALNLWWKSDISASLFTWGVFQPLQPFCEFCCLRHRAVELVGSCHGTHGVHNLMRGFHVLFCRWTLILGSEPDFPWRGKTRIENRMLVCFDVIPTLPKLEQEEKRVFFWQALPPGVPPWPATLICRENQCSYMNYKWKLLDQQHSSDNIRMRVLQMAVRVMSVSLEFTREPGSQVDEVQGALNGRVFWSPERSPIRADAPYGDMKYCTWTKDQTIPKS